MFFDFLHIFTDLFNSAEKAWHKLEPKVQDALIHGSGIIKILNDNLEKTPDVVFTIIQEKYPDITKEYLHDGLNKVAEAFKIPDADLLTTIENLQVYLLSMSGSGEVFDAIRSALAQILAIALAPKETLFAKIVSLVEWVFRKKVK